MIAICKLCQKAYEPEETKGIRVLQQFKGFTVDVRLQQFRKVDYGMLGGIEFIEFSSPEGQMLLSEMHKSVVN